MESPAEKVSRLVGALEILLDQVFGAILSGDYPNAIGLQDRAQPVIDEISRLMVEPGLRRRLDADTQARVDRLLRDQLSQLDHIAADQSVARRDLEIIRTAQSRTQHFRAAYGSSRITSPQSNYAGSG